MFNNKLIILKINIHLNMMIFTLNVLLVKKDYQKIKLKEIIKHPQEYLD